MIFTFTREFYFIKLFFITFVCINGISSQFTKLIQSPNNIVTMNKMLHNHEVLHIIKNPLNNNAHKDSLNLFRLLKSQRRNDMEDQEYNQEEKDNYDEYNNGKEDKTYNDSYYNEDECKDQNYREKSKLPRNMFNERNKFKNSFRQKKNQENKSQKQYDYDETEDDNSSKSHYRKLNTKFLRKKPKSHFITDGNDFEERPSIFTKFPKSKSLFFNDKELNKNFKIHPFISEIIQNEEDFEDKFAQSFTSKFPTSLSLKSDSLASKFFNDEDNEKFLENKRPFNDNYSNMEADSDEFKDYTYSKLRPNGHMPILVDSKMFGQRIKKPNEWKSELIAFN